MRIQTALLAMMLGFTPGGVLVHAQEPADEAQHTESRAETADGSKTREGKPGRHPVRTLEEFIPSEEISADKPVSFPADI